MMNFEDYTNKLVRPCARGVILCGNELLLLKDLECPNSYVVLPGGGIDSGESSKDALMRELREEIGFSPESFRFLGCFEQCFSRSDIGRVHDLSLLFSAEISKELRACISAVETCYKVEWVSLNELQRIALVPTELKGLIPRLLKKDFDNALVSAFP